MGFVDHDLKTPGHDAIMLWLDEQMNQSLQGWLSLSGWTAQEHELPAKDAPKWQAYIRLTQTTLAEGAVWDPNTLKR